MRLDPPSVAAGAGLLRKWQPAEELLDHQLRDLMAMNKARWERIKIWRDLKLRVKLSELEALSKKFEVLIEKAFPRT